MSILSIKNMSKSYGKHRVLNDVSFYIDQPKIIALVGPNGSGKSTMLNCITNLLHIDSGSIEVLGQSNTDPNIFKEVAYLKDNRVLYPYLSGYDHLKYIQDVQKLPKQRMDEVVDIIGIRSYVRQKTGTYSLGMKQHLLLAMAIMNKPKLLLMDEPLNGLDPTSVLQVRELIKSLFKEQTTILLSSHSLSEIDFITTDILFLKDGKVIEEDISIYQKVIYHFDLVEEIEEINLKNLSFSYITENQKLIVEDDSNAIQSYISEMTEKGIVFDVLSKVNIGAEDRYKALFGEE